MSQVISFPLSRRVSQVRRIASALQSFHGESANSFWRHEVALIAKELRAIGMDDEAIRNEIYALQSAVQDEFRMWSLAQSQGGGAA